MCASLRSAAAVLICVLVGDCLAIPGSSGDKKLLGVHWHDVYGRDFCLQDFDQDGMSNGMELGGERDPLMQNESSEV